MSLVLFRQELDLWKPGQHTGTFRGNNLAFVAANSLLQYWKDDTLTKQIQENSLVISKTLGQLVQQLDSNRFHVRGRGMVWGLDCTDGEFAGQVCRTAFQKGLLIETSGAHDQVVKLLPPLTISRNDLEYGLQIIVESVLSVAGKDTQPVLYLPPLDLDTNHLSSVSGIVTT